MWRRPWYGRSISTSRTRSQRGRAAGTVRGDGRRPCRLAAHAETKDALVPLAFLKGLGRQDGTVMTWHVDVAAGKLTVNGQDLTAMFGPPG